MSWEMAVSPRIIQRIYGKILQNAWDFCLNMLWFHSISLRKTTCSQAAKGSSPAGLLQALRTPNCPQLGHPLLFKLHLRSTICCCISCLAARGAGVHLQGWLHDYCPTLHCVLDQQVYEDGLITFLVELQKWNTAGSKRPFFGFSDSGFLLSCW